MGLILGRKDGGKVKERKDKGGKVKMTASSHWASLWLVGGRKRGVRICFLLSDFYFLSFFLSLLILISCPLYLSFHVPSLSSFHPFFLFPPSLLFLFPSFLLYVLSFSFPCFTP